MGDHTQEKLPNNYQLCVTKGVCVTCRIEPAMERDGKKYARCRECAGKLAKYQSALYLEREKRGRCRRCDDKPIKGQTLCELHHNLAKAARDRFRARHKG